MKLEHQVVSLELAKKLKELNCPQESLFWWCVENECVASEPSYDGYCESCSLAGETISAHTVAELGEMLPDKTNSWHSGVMPPWSCSVFEYDPEKWHQVQADTEADARAKMLIYLIQNELVEPKTLSV